MAMRASVLDLRYRMKEVLKALERRERVSLLYHGKVKGAIVPVGEERVSRTAEHPFFGMASRSDESVVSVMDRLRGGRYR
jgi:antitoxin (DNA-binding transcriptional repressor) of toxin-antitoxin stability system